MPDSPPPAEPVGVILARQRKRKGLTGKALADLVGMSQAKISRLENGVVTPEPADVRLIAETLDMPAADIEHVVELAEHGDYQLTEWTSAQFDLTASQREFNRNEATAKEIRVFQPAVIPGLLQTNEYARAIMKSVKDEVADVRLADSDRAVFEAANARMQRNEILLAPHRQFHFLFTEQVLRNRVCAPSAMLAQIDHVREVAEFPNVDLRIIPDDAELPIAPYHGFEVADERWATVDLFDSGLRSTVHQRVLAYRRIFDALERVAVTDLADLLDRYQAHYARMLLPDSVPR